MADTKGLTQAELQAKMLRLRKEIMDVQHELKDEIGEACGDPSFTNFRYSASSNCFVQRAYDLLDPNCYFGAAFEFIADRVYLEALSAIWTFYHLAMEQAPFEAFEEQEDEFKEIYFAET